jgi:hypothetical protein
MLDEFPALRWIWCSFLASTSKKIALASHGAPTLENARVSGHYRQSFYLPGALFATSSGSQDRRAKT